MRLVRPGEVDYRDLADCPEPVLEARVGIRADTDAACIVHQESIFKQASASVGGYVCL